MKLFKNWTKKKNNKKRSEKVQHTIELNHAVSEYFDWDNEKVYSFFKYCEITDVFKKKDVFYITLKRPGMFIGRKGIVIDGIKKCFNVKYDIKLIEDKKALLIDGILYSDY